MFNHNYGINFQGMKHFIPATPCSYFLTGASSSSNNRYFAFLNKIRRGTLDTIKTVVYMHNTCNVALTNFIKLSDNKYYLIGNKFSTVKEWPFILSIDSNLTTIDTINTFNPNGFAINNAVYNPITKRLLLAGPTSIPGLGYNMPVTFMQVDTLGNTINGVTIKTQQDGYGLTQVFYSAFDNSYVTVGGRQTSWYGGLSLDRLTISKIDALTLMPLWHKTYGDEAYINALYDAVILPDGSIVASGGYSPLTSLPLMNEDCGGVILKVDKDGNLQWFREYNNYVTPTDSHLYWETFFGIDTTREQGFMLSGSVMGQPKAKAWAVKTDGQGCVIPGCASSTVTVQDVVVTTKTVNVTKPVSPPPTTTTATGMESYYSSNINVYPNPVSKLLVVEVGTDKIDETIALKFVDLFGREVKKLSIEESTAIDVADLSRGIYFLQLYENERLVATKKIIRE